MNHLITQLRRATPADCFDIYTVHRLAVRYTCLTSYTPEILKHGWLCSTKTVIRLRLHLKIKNCGWLSTKTKSVASFCWICNERSWTRYMFIRFCIIWGWERHCCNVQKRWCWKQIWVFWVCTLPLIPLRFTRSMAMKLWGEAVMPFNAKISANCTLMRKFLQ